MCVYVKLHTPKTNMHIYIYIYIYIYSHTHTNTCLYASIKYSTAYAMPKSLAHQQTYIHT